MLGFIEFGQETIRYEVRFLTTRKTLGIEVHPDESVRVRAPVGCTAEVIEQRIKRRASWISKQITHFRRFSPRTPPRRYVSGETHLYLGRQYRLRVCLGEMAGVRMGRSQLLVTVPSKSDTSLVKTMLQRWYLDRARQVFGKVLDQCLARFKGRQRPRVIVRTMQSRWGSLSPAGTMTLNTDLIRAPRACIEYVVIHELCHLKHRDHGAGFFRMLGQVLPTWELRKQQLEIALL